MSRYTYVTASGSEYEVDFDKQLWKKNGGPSERIWWAHGVDSEEANKCKDWSDVEVAPRTNIREGVHLYIGSRDVWWLSTPIKEVIEHGKDRADKDDGITG